MGKSVAVFLDLSYSLTAQSSIRVNRNITVWRVEDFFVIDLAPLHQFNPSVVFEPSIKHVRLNPRRAQLVGNRNARPVEREHVVGSTNAIDRNQAYEHLRHNWQ